jgi:DNA-binding NtrC family response regulator
MRRFRILLVDDSPNIRKAMVRIFRDEGYDIITAESASAALAVLSREIVDVIISDQQMPGLTGNDLLRTVRERFPDLVRIMVTGADDIEVAKDAINSGHIYRFFTKPWDDFELVLAVRDALKMRAMARENLRLKAALDQQTLLLQELEKEHPGIAERTLTKDGAIVIDG